MPHPAADPIADVLVIGSGPGGAITACLLAEAGRDVVLVEEEPWLTLAPADLSGVLAVGPVLLTPDGRAYVYGYRRTLSDLYAVSGLR